MGKRPTDRSSDTDSIFRLQYIGRRFQGPIFYRAIVSDSFKPIVSLHRHQHFLFKLTTPTDNSALRSAVTQNYDFSKRDDGQNQRYTRSRYSWRASYTGDISGSAVAPSIPAASTDAATNCMELHKYPCVCTVLVHMFFFNFLTGTKL
jgi:hypothetical protein